MQKTWVQFLGQEDPLEKEMATHSSMLAWKIPWTQEPGRLQSMGSQESDTTERLNTHTHTLSDYKLKVPDAKQSVFFKPCPQGTKHFIALIDVPAFPEPSSLLHTGGHPSSGMFLLHWGIGQSKLEMRQGKTGSRAQHLQPAWCCQGRGLPQACSPCHVSLCCLGGVCSICKCQPCTFLSSRKAPDAIGRQWLCSLHEEAAGSGRGLARSNVHLLLVILAWATGSSLQCS